MSSFLAPIGRCVDSAVVAVSLVVDVVGFLYANVKWLKMTKRLCDSSTLLIPVEMCSSYSFSFTFLRLVSCWWFQEGSRPNGMRYAMFLFSLDRWV